ncbi:hypothetical protein CLV28_0404 [Sediminihabitans luteus]|uniref:Uncharacterized protein n=1 Tax=Sediminihabitans luteus TaxID=1138585 RepID=A0A2M9CZ56_9CELL|nr:hypothetical protein [Sediminihabitans luteus]PJJ77190.1 hypothetical protein CLV28_0404 [Sediminihabitans luteus]GII98638.1 hypothetical protein Slu03_10160 [Sediminihabitans luteus]
MKKHLAPAAAALIALGMVVVPAGAASAAVKNGTFSCGSRIVAVTASAPTQVSLTVDGYSASQRSAQGAAVTLYAYDGVATYSARSTDSSVAVSFRCLPR